jgi:hypothetical protein
MGLPMLKFPISEKEKKLELLFWGGFGGFFPADPVHESTSFIALALFMNAFA